MTRIEDQIRDVQIDVRERPVLTAEKFAEIDADGRSAADVLADVRSHFLTVAERHGWDEIEAEGATCTECGADLDPESFDDYCESCDPDGQS